MLVLFACINQTGCNESYSTYYHNKPSIQELVQNTESKLKNYTNPLVFEYAAPTAFALAGRDVNFKLNRNFSFRYNKEILKLAFKKEW